MKVPVAAGCVLILISGAVLASPRNVISPVPARGMKVMNRDGRPTAVGRVADLGFAASVSSGQGFLKVHLQVGNLGGRTLETDEQSVVLLSPQGERVEPLDPKSYVDLRFKVDPAELDRNGRPVKDREVGFRHPGARDTQKSMMEVLTQQDTEDADWEESVLAARELRSLEQSPLAKPTRIKPGASRTAWLVFQRNHVPVPFLLDVRSEGKRVRIRFERR